MPLRKGRRPLGEKQAGESNKQAIKAGEAEGLKRKESIYVPSLRSSSPVLSRSTRSIRQPRAPTSPLPPSSLPSSSSYAQRMEHTSSDDPFGFLAVEKRLKAKRVHDPTQHARAPCLLLSDTSTEMQVPSEAGSAFAFAMPTPPPRRSILDDSPNVDLDAGTPIAPTAGQLHTPRRRSRKRKPAATPSSPRGRSSAPSTPSPSKPSRRPLGGPLLEPLLLAQPEVKLKQGRAKRLCEGASTKGDKQDSMQAAVQLESLLPRRPVRRSARVSATRGKAETAPKATLESNSKGKKAKVKPKAVAKKHDKANYHEEFFDLEGEDRDRIASERQERIDYFKRLESYQVEKENVYLV